MTHRKMQSSEDRDFNSALRILYKEIDFKSVKNINLRFSTSPSFCWSQAKKDVEHLINCYHTLPKKEIEEVISGFHTSLPKTPQIEDAIYVASQAMEKYLSIRPEPEHTLELKTK